MVMVGCSFLTGLHTSTTRVSFSFFPMASRFPCRPLFPTNTKGKKKCSQFLAKGRHERATVPTRGRPQKENSCTYNNDKKLRYARQETIGFASPVKYTQPTRGTATGSVNGVKQRKKCCLFTGASSTTREASSAPVKPRTYASNLIYSTIVGSCRTARYRSNTA